MKMLPLRPVTPEWEAAWQELMSRNEWLSFKIRRSRRLREHYMFLDHVAPELPRTERGWVIDLGPGPGELLEIARDCGHKTLGVDAPNGTGGMGDDYLKASRMMWERQGLTVVQPPYGALDVSDGYFPIPAKEGECVLINSRGSFEQIFSAFLKGRPHHKHHNCKLQTWKVDDNGLQCYALPNFFRWAARMLRPGGALVIRCNGSRNEREVDEMLRRCARRESSLRLWDEQHSHLTNVWRKRK